MDEVVDYYTQHGPPKNQMPRYGKDIDSNYTKKTNALYRCRECNQVWQSIWNRQIEFLPHFKNLPATIKTCMYCESKGDKNGK